EISSGTICGLTHERPSFIDSCPYLKERDYPGGFNWGAFFLTPIWLLFHKKVLIGILMILLNLFFQGLISSRSELVIPVFILILIINGYFGIAGNKISWLAFKEASYDDTAKKEKRWNIAGIVVFIILVILNIIPFIT
ncbi:hypothetical protein ACFLR4_01135, partial [Bacteroidota bacterium]